jgi:Arc-like DNA binding domain
LAAVWAVPVAAHRSIRSRTARTISLACEAALRAAWTSSHSFTSSGSRTINFGIVRLCILTSYLKAQQYWPMANQYWPMAKLSRGIWKMGRQGAKMSDKFPSRALEKVIWRLPDGMRDRLAEAAIANNRTVNAEAVSRLQKSFDAGLSGWGGLRLNRPDGTHLTEEEALARPSDLPPSFRQESLEKQVGEQIESGFGRLEGVIDRLEKRLERLERGLLVPPPVPKGPLWPPPKVKSHKD